MSLTVAEKEHWKERISKRITQKIDSLMATDPAFMKRIDSEATKAARVSLGIDTFNDEIEAIEKQTAELAKRKEKLEAAMREQVLKTVEDTGAGSGRHSYCYSNPVDDAVKLRKKAHAAKLMAETELGQQILKLQQEREELLDTVWLATSPAQIKKLWETVIATLGQENTEMQAAALSIEPMDE
jgi:hypothetical protein